MEENENESVNIELVSKLIAGLTVIWIFVILFADIPSISCDTLADACTIHTRSIIKGESPNIQTFTISDITGHHYKERYRRRSSSRTYIPVLEMRDCRQIRLKSFRFGNTSSVDVFVNKIRNEKDFKHKGTIFEVIFKNYRFD